METQYSSIGPFVREVGTGSPVLCLHSSAGSSKQWLPLMELLGTSYRMVAPDLYGYGQSPEWPDHRPLSLTDEIALIEPVMSTIREPFHLVGHSYGGAVALAVALRYPERIQSLVVYEPVLFNLLFENNGNDEATERIRNVAHYVRHLTRDGRSAEAARLFIDYWTGMGSWEQLHQKQQEAITARMGKVASDFDSTFGNIASQTDYERLRIPTLLLYGLRSPSSTVRISELLGNALPMAEMRGFGHMGHMGPVTHPTDVNRLIRQFINWHEATNAANRSSRVA